jgi:hypothetical protein
MERRRFISQLSLAGLGAVGLAKHNSIFPGQNTIIEDSKHSIDKEATMMISVKMVKAKPGFCTTMPQIKFPLSNTGWFLTSQLNKNGDYDGENVKEIYFNIQSEATEFQPVQLTLIVPGMEAARVIVGKTDVPFQQQGEEVQFKIIDDRSIGQYMKDGNYQSPLGGYPIGFIHNWNIRKAGKFALERFPSKKFAAIPNYLLAAQEVFRQMGDMGPVNRRSFNGEISLLGSEVASSRGHMDYPPHVHIMFYEFPKGKHGDFNNMLSRLVPHFYMDDNGNIIHNHYDRIAGSNGSPSGEYGIGDVVSFVDAEENHVLDLIIEDKGGLTLRPSDGRLYSIRPDPLKGPAKAVDGYFNKKQICRAEVHDYPDLGVFRVHLDVLNDKKMKTIDDGYLYDVFTAREFSKL